MLRVFLVADDDAFEAQERIFNEHFTALCDRERIFKPLTSTAPTGGARPT